MRWIRVPHKGGTDRLRLEVAPDPVPGAGEVLVGVEAAGVNYADCCVRMGVYASAAQYVGWPITPGFDIAGRVLAAGAGVDAPPAGAAVLGVTRFGGYADRVVVPAHQVFERPPQVDAVQGAAFPTVFLTAWYAAVELAAVRPGQHVLVHSAAGGVGSALVQLARLRGARVVGVVGAAHKVGAVEALGADAVVDRSAEPLWPTVERHAPGGYHAVFDANGPATLRGSYAHLAPTGRLVVYGFHSMLPRRGGRPNPLRLWWNALRIPRFNPLHMTTENRSVMAFNLSYLFDERALLERAMGELLGWLGEGRVRLPAITTYPLDRVADAHRDLESGRTVGKLVLIP